MPASFPTSVKNYGADLVDGVDYPQAAHVNDLRSEVTAIEGGYVNGTAPLNSSASTMATLSVTGGSTFAGPVTIPSTGAVCARLRMTAPVQVANGVTVSVDWDTQDVVQRMTHSTATNSSRLVVDVPGIYVVGAQVKWPVNASGECQVWITKTDVDVLELRQDASSIALFQRLITLTPMSSGDYFTLNVTQDSGSTRSLSTNAIYATVLWAAKVGV